MDRIGRFAAVVILCVLLAMIVKSYAINQISPVNEGRKNVIVEIDYGEVRPSRMVKRSWVKDMTALEILQSVAEVKTHPVGQYVFVVSIDGVEGKRGEMGWYYTIDGKSADKLAYSKVLNDVSYIKWIYKKDICSEKVDS